MRYGRGIFLSVLLSVATIATNTLFPADIVVEIVSYDVERDYEAVRDIFIADSKHLTYPDKPLEYTEQYLTSKNYITKVCRVDGKTVGFVNYCVYEAKFLWGLVNLGTRGLVHLLGIDSDHRRNGYAERLMRVALEDIREQDAKKVILSVESDNEGALKLYEKLGFEKSIFSPLLTMDMQKQ